jgi:hypothetical protein
MPAGLDGLRRRLAPSREANALIVGPGSGYGSHWPAVPVPSQERAAEPCARPTCGSSAYSLSSGRTRTVDTVSANGGNWISGGAGGVYGIWADISLSVTTMARRSRQSPIAGCLVGPARVSTDVVSGSSEVRSYNPTRCLQTVVCKGGHHPLEALYLALGSDLRIIWATEPITAP